MLDGDSWITKFYNSPLTTGGVSQQSKTRLDVQGLVRNPNHKENGVHEVKTNHKTWKMN